MLLQAAEIFTSLAVSVLTWLCPAMSHPLQGKKTHGP
jgi:hypothetical protein